MTHVVFYSGGVASWATAKRVASTHGTEHLKLLFTDTLIEDPDLYRFLEESALNVGGELIKIADGRTPWQVFRDERMLGNSRVDPCSRILKRELAKKWVKTHYPNPDDVVLYIGMAWDEGHRAERSSGYWQPYVIEAPLLQQPYLQKDELLQWVKREGMEPPRLYALGFSHNNCGGGCVKAGVAHFRHLLKVLPDVYAEWERNEEQIRQHLGKDVTILRHQVDSERRNISLAELRQQPDNQCDLFDWGGCGCFAPNEDEMEGENL
jgi:hypothetical protein